MREKLLKIKNRELPKVLAGKAKNAQDFVNQIIKPQFINKELVKRTHESLMNYIELPGATFVLRLYGSSNKSYDNLRRGFLTEYPDGKKMVFCDNTFAMPFMAMRISGITYTTDELVKYMNDSSTRFGLSITKEEKELAFYNWSGSGININLNVQGWYLAHIIPVGKDFLGRNLSKYFSNPKREDWLSQKNHIRSPKNDLTDKELSVLKAHFLRLVHPLNSFIVPKRNLLTYDGFNIGEETEVINLVHTYLENEFPKEFFELNKVVLATEKSFPLFSKIGEIIWDANASNNKKEKSRLASSRKMQNAKKASANEMWETFTVDSMNNSNEIPSLEDYLKEEESREKAMIDEEIAKVKRRVPRWINKPGQINSQILQLFMELSHNNEIPVKRDELQKGFEKDHADPFYLNYVQMKNFGPNNHAKVFEEDAWGNIGLWKHVADFIVGLYENKPQ